MAKKNVSLWECREFGALWMIYEYPTKFILIDLKSGQRLEQLK